MKLQEPLTIAFFRHRYDTQPRSASVTWPHLARLLSRHQCRRHKDGPLWSPTVYPAGLSRANANVQALTVLVFEFDGQEPDWSLLEGTAFVAHTTHSNGLTLHEQDKDGNPIIKPASPRWRLALRLLRAVPAAEWGVTWRRARAHYAPQSDPACGDASRMFYLPSYPPGAPTPGTRACDGTPIDPDGLPETPDERQQPQVSSIRSPLRPVPPTGSYATLGPKTRDHLYSTGSGRYPSPSEADAAAAAALIAGGRTAGEALALLLDSPRGQDALARKGRHGEKYLQRTVQHAAAFVGPVVDRGGVRVQYSARPWRPREIA